MNFWAMAIRSPLRFLQPRHGSADSYCQAAVAEVDRRLKRPQLLDRLV